MVARPPPRSSGRDTPRTLVIGHIGRSVRAVWHPHDDGTVEVCFLSGEIFLLGEHAVTRLV
jgi:hypothetical protein